MKPRVTEPKARRVSPLRALFYQSENIVGAFHELPYGHTGKH